MPGRPRMSARPALPRVPVPLPPEKMTRQEQEVWNRLAGEVEKVGSYDEGAFSAFKLMVRAVSAAEAVDLTDPDTAGTRCIALANTALANFGLLPSARKNVPAAPLLTGDADKEFTDPPQLRVVGAKKPWEKP